MNISKLALPFLLTTFSISVGAEPDKNTNKFTCIANNQASCNQGDNQLVNIDNEYKYYLTDGDISYICNANGYKSICAQGDGQSLKIDGVDMAGAIVKHDNVGDYILHRK